MHNFYPTFISQQTILNSGNTPQNHLSAAKTHTHHRIYNLPKTTVYITISPPYHHNSTAPPLHSVSIRLQKLNAAVRYSSSPHFRCLPFNFHNLAHLLPPPLKPLFQTSTQCRSTNQNLTNIKSIHNTSILLSSQWPKLGKYRVYGRHLRNTVASIDDYIGVLSKKGQAHNITNLFLSLRKTEF